MYQTDYYDENLNRMKIVLKLNDIIFLNSFSLDNDIAIYCYNNTFGNGCFNNTFGNDCRNNTFGNDCRGHTFGNGCYNNIFGNGCYHNTFGNGYYNNTFGICCYSNTFGNHCSHNTFGNDCHNNTFGNDCYNNIFEHRCSDITFGKPTRPISHVTNVKFGSDCSYIRLLNTELTTNEVKNITISQGIRGTFGKIVELQVERNAPPVVYEAANTKHIILD